MAVAIGSNAFDGLVGNTAIGTNQTGPNFNGNYVNRAGFDLVWLQSALQTQMTSIEADITSIESNANLSDTEKMFSMQMSMNTWSAVSNLRTNMLKSVSDTLKTITRNVS